MLHICDTILTSPFSLCFQCLLFHGMKFVFHPGHFEERDLLRRNLEALVVWGGGEICQNKEGDNAQEEQEGEGEKKKWLLVARQGRWWSSCRVDSTIGEFL